MRDGKILPGKLGIIQAIEKLQKKCIIKFSDAEMRVICNNDANEGGIQVWSYVVLFTSHVAADGYGESDQSRLNIHQLPDPIER